MGACKSCALIARREAGDAPPWDSIWRTAHWDVVHSYNSALPGWMVLIVRRHIESISDLTPDEASELGTLLQQVATALQAITGCVKSYVIQFAEAAEHPHVHFHVVPRMADQPAERRGPAIFGYLGSDEREWVSETHRNDIAHAMRAALTAAER